MRAVGAAPRGHLGGGAGRSGAPAPATLEGARLNRPQPPVPTGRAPLVPKPRPLPSAAASIHPCPAPLQLPDLFPVPVPGHGGGRRRCGGGGGPARAGRGAELGGMARMNVALQELGHAVSVGREGRRGQEGGRGGRGDSPRVGAGELRERGRAAGGCGEKEPGGERGSRARGMRGPGGLPTAAGGEGQRDLPAGRNGAARDEPTALHCARVGSTPGACGCCPTARPGAGGPIFPMDGAGGARGLGPASASGCQERCGWR